MNITSPGGAATRWALRAFIAAAFSLAAFPGADAATVGGSVVASTDYVYRGLTYSDRKPVLQADLYARTASGWFAGAWGSIAASHPERQSRSEFNAYVGKAWSLGPDWLANVHYARYFYTDSRAEVRYFYEDYDELQVSLSFQDRATLSVALAPDVRRWSIYGPEFRSGKQWSYEASARQPLWNRVALIGGLGYYDLQDLFGQSYWGASAGAELAVKPLRLTLTRFFVESNARRLFGTQTADDRWALTAAWRF